MSFPFKLPFEFKGLNPNEELPKPEEIMAAATAFPPKLSVMQKIPALPEAMFEKTVLDITGMTIPPGPNRMLASMMASVEASLPAAPALPGAAEPKTSSELTPPSSVEAPTPKRRFELL